MKKNWSYKIKEGEHKGVTLWSGRYCAVTGVILVQCQNEYFVLANKRGAGTPDFQGLWNCPCGFLEADETGEEGCCREILEETGLNLESEWLRLYDVETDPKLCNNGNVTLRYYNIYIVPVLPTLKPTGGEENEVSEVKWIKVSEVDNHEWAFNHALLIKKIYAENSNLSKM